MFQLFKKICFFGLTYLCATAYAGSESGKSGFDLSVIPDHIGVSTFYHGTEVHIYAEVPVIDGAVLKIEGQDKEVILNKKGKVVVIWLNLTYVKVKNAPQVYILAASDRLENICSPQERRELGLGLEELGERITFESDKPLNGLELNEFIKLKEHVGTYNVGSLIDVSPADQGKQILSATLPIPSAIPPGEYVIRLFCFRDGKLAHRGTIQLSIEKVGLTGFLAALANNHAAVYGVLAIAVAMIAGIIMGVVFNTRSGRAK